MSRYFFNIHHDDVELDPEGQDLPDQDAAWEEATTAAGEILRDLDGQLRPGHDWRMEVTDDLKHVLFVLQISAKKS